jgi:hypothetical protein
MLIIAPILALGCLWCTAPGASLAHPEGHVHLSPAVRCTADVARHTLECEQSTPRSVAAGADQAARISVVLSNAGYDPRTLVYSFDSEITNLLPYPIGTPDCRSVTGLKVFVEAGPTATGDAPWATIDRLSALPYVTRAVPDILTQGLIPMAAPSPR